MIKRKQKVSTVSPEKERIVIDSAGAVKGGAARFLRELRSYLSDHESSNVELIGMNRKLTASWLVQREINAASADRRISLNNAGFVNPRGQNVTLLRNILQFATRNELERLRFRPPLRLKAQTPVVRQLARSSDALIVPCTRMAQQVASISPSLKEKLKIRFHPVSKPSWAGRLPQNPHDVLLPIVPSPYKNLDEHIPEFLAASEKRKGIPIRLIIPAPPEILPTLSKHPRLQFIGPQTSEELDRWWQKCGAVFFPVEFESFGYPLAESRVYGRSVIAQHTSQNLEIAAHSLHSYVRHDLSSLAGAIRSATESVPAPDPVPFDPVDYFTWLLGDDLSGARTASNEWTMPQGLSGEQQGHYL